MSYTALYRTLRPTTFENMVGQNHIVRTLTNQIIFDKTSHAYLFSGVRGTGKTSLAKIFARSINCNDKNNGSASPCNVCEPCIASLENRSVNVIEIDAASNNGVDNIRDIKEEIRYTPAVGRYKIYIIDEVHMLSIGAFNALLKTLEEPPRHVIFILATTDPQKIPATIHSRCQSFEFKRIKTSDIQDTLKKYTQKEAISIDDDALHYIAKIADGGLRDALSILDQAIAFYNDENITLQRILDIVGAVDDAILFEFTNALIAKDSLKCIELIEQVYINGRDIRQLIADLILHFRNLLVSKNLHNTTTALDISDITKIDLNEQSQSASNTILMEYISTFSDVLNKIRFEKKPRIFLEVLCIKLCQNEIHEDITNVSKKTLPPKPKNKSSPIKKAMSDDIKLAIAKWDDFSTQFEMTTQGLIKNTRVGSLNDDILYIVAPDKGLASFLAKKESEINDKLTQFFSLKYNMKIIDKDEYDKQHEQLFATKDTVVNELVQEIENKIDYDDIVYD